MPTTARKSGAAAQRERQVDGRQATQAAFTYFRTLFSDRSFSEPSLEEIEMSKDGQFWLVTLGFNAPRPANKTLPDFLQVPIRKLKVFKVDAATGQVLSMKIPKEE